MKKDTHLAVIIIMSIIVFLLFGIYEYLNQQYVRYDGEYIIEILLFATLPASISIIELYNLKKNESKKVN
jgi:hypothetical protein